MIPCSSQSDPGLFAWWSFDKGEDRRVHDQAGQIDDEILGRHERHIEAA